MLEYIGSVNRYLPSHVKNGIVILLCILERIIAIILMYIFEPGIKHMTLGYKGP